jgi:hypothetical protein
VRVVLMSLHAAHSLPLSPVSPPADVDPWLDLLLLHHPRQSLALRGAIDLLRGQPTEPTDQGAELREGHGAARQVHQVHAAAGSMSADRDFGARFAEGGNFRHCARVHARSILFDCITLLFIIHAPTLFDANPVLDMRIPSRGIAFSKSRKSAREFRISRSGLHCRLSAVPLPCWLASCSV